MKEYEVIVVGAGHAGCEAALAAARKGHKTLICSVSLENIALLACNPSIGGTAKGHLVREIDALGGEIGLAADRSLLQLKMLNTGKGAAVQSLRAQTDKYAYHINMKATLENEENIDLLSSEVSDILVEGGRVSGVKTVYGEQFAAKAVILACGVYLKSDIITGLYRKNSGPSGFSAANKLSDSIKALGFELRRFKTGTPARADGKSLDYSAMQRQDGEEGLSAFSFLSEGNYKNKLSCYLTYTTPKTHDIIRENLHLSPMYSGMIKGTGARYCPSIEDKVVRFADKDRHQVFIEPEGEFTSEVYLQGLSTSLPVQVQQQMYKSITGMENIRITRYAYAIEYDCIDSTRLTSALRAKEIEGLYFAGQINGSSGYEEAAAQGLIAGINAALYLENKPPYTPSRAESYIGVLIDDLVIKGTNEPYRMMTARAENRLALRQDNADFRLTEQGREIGLVDDRRWNKFLRRKESTENIRQALKKSAPPAAYKQLFLEKGEPEGVAAIRYEDMLKRPQIRIADLQRHFNLFEGAAAFELEYAENEIKYGGYLIKQNQANARAKKLENAALPADFDYQKLSGLRIEARQKLNRLKPSNVAEASRISGVSPADIAVLIMYISSGKLR